MESDKKLNPSEELLIIELDDRYEFSAIPVNNMCINVTCIDTVDNRCTNCYCY